MGSLGGLFKASKTARKNLEQAMPDLSNKEYGRIIRGVWNNLGRTFAEFPHVVDFSQKQFDQLVEVEGHEVLRKFLANKEPLILFTAHFGNWEIISRYFVLNNMDVNIIYRPANNRMIDDEVVRLRTKNSNITMCEKGVLGAGKAIKNLLRNESMAIFVDQKLSEGIDVPFFGRNAKTTGLMANIALKRNIPLFPLHIERDGNKFKLYIEDPIYVNEEGCKNDYDVMLRINKVIERWVRRKPEEWFWVHNRW